MINKNQVPYYKVITLQIGVFASIIIDEQHFGSLGEAKNFRDRNRTDTHVCVIIKM